MFSLICVNLVTHSHTAAIKPPCYRVQGAEVQQRKLQQQLSATERRAREQQRSLQQEVDAARDDLEVARQELAEVTFSRLSCA